MKDSKAGSAPAARPDVLARLRSLAQFLGMVASTCVWAILSMFTFALPYRQRYRFIMQWCRFNIWWLKVTCGIEHEVRGLENIPRTPAVVMSKHQSTWETLALREFFDPQTWVLKRELLRVPFFGWALTLLEPIAIDRGSPSEAVRQMVAKGKQRLQQGRWVIVFPEGTRVKPGETAKYRPGGALLACQSGSPVVPVAHNAGEYWARHQFVKRPGTIRVRIGPPISTEGRSPKEINQLVEQWIEAQMAEISGS